MSNEQRTQGGLSPKTLLIAGAASAVAAFIVPKLWQPGTVYAAAMTPVVVALISELLRHPVEKVSAVRRVPRRVAAPQYSRSYDEPFDPLAPPSQEELEALPETTAPTGAVHTRRPRLTSRQWKLALVTGLVAFAGAAAFVTATDLVAGKPVSGGGSSGTTFFGSTRHKAAQPNQQQKQQATPTPGATDTPTPTSTPAPTTSPTPTVSATPTPPAPAAGAAPAVTPTPTP